MSESQAQTPAQKMIGDFSPKLVSLTDDVLFGDVWARKELSPRDRSLITVAALIAGGNTEQLSSHLMRCQPGSGMSFVVSTTVPLARRSSWWRGR
jgi:4-carboxymuconolactone decarboxylase